jgi:hypothetical protein
MRLFSLVAAACLWGSLSAQVMIPPNQANDDYSAQNSGKTGLIEMPNARVLDDWHLRPHYFYSDPFIYYGLTIAPLPRFEINLRMTQVQGVPGFGDSAGYGDYKDKAIDLKFLLMREDEILPAIAIGFDDIHGTGLYSSKYLVASKRLDFLDLSAGYALGRMGGEDLRKYGANNSSDRGMNFLTSTEVRGGSFFAGAEAHITPDLSLKAEYSPIEYRYDYVNPFTRRVSPMPKHDVNVGVKYKLSKKVALSANFERGTSYGVGININFPFDEEGLYPHEADPRWRAAPGTKERFEKEDDENLSKIIANEIAAERFSNVQVAINGGKIWASLENPRYNSHLKALGRAADVIDEVAPDRIDELYLALKRTDLEYSVIHVYRDDVAKIKQDGGYRVNEEIIDFSDNVDEEYEKFTEGQEVYKTDSLAGKKFAWLFKPSLQSFLNDKEKPLTYKFSLLGGSRYEIRPGGYFFGRLRFPLVNTTDDISQDPEEPAYNVTRTDTLKYLQYNSIQLQDLVIDQTVKLPWKLYGRGEVGYMEPAYGGVDLELYRPFAGGAFGLGVQYQNVRKRRVDDWFAFEKTRFEGKFVNLFADLVPELGIKTTAKVGQFFAGDKGVSLTLLRKYKYFTLGAFVTKTTTDMFKSEKNQGYMDKGVFMNIPISTISPKNIKGSLNYSLKPWTRDVAQYANSINSLVGLEPANVYEMRSQMDYFKD